MFPPNMTLEHWIVYVVATMVVGGFTLFLKLDRDRIASDARTALKLATETDKQMAVLAKGNEAIQQQLQKLDKGQEIILNRLERV